MRPRLSTRNLASAVMSSGLVGIALAANPPAAEASAVRYCYSHRPADHGCNELYFITNGVKGAYGSTNQARNLNYGSAWIDAHYGQQGKYGAPHVGYSGLSVESHMGSAHNGSFGSVRAWNGPYDTLNSLLWAWARAKSLCCGGQI